MIAPYSKSREKNTASKGLYRQAEPADVGHFGKELANPSMRPPKEGRCDNNEI